jgi:hypothetical protein
MTLSDSIYTGSILVIDQTLPGEHLALSKQNQGPVNTLVDLPAGYGSPSGMRREQEFRDVGQCLDAASNTTVVNFEYQRDSTARERVGLA